MKEKEKEKVMIIKGKTQLCSAMYVQYDCVIRIKVHLCYSNNLNIIKLFIQTQEMNT